jgi:hypothetical protein
LRNTRCSDGRQSCGDAVGKRKHCHQEVQVFPAIVPALHETHKSISAPVSTGE